MFAMKNSQNVPKNKFIIKIASYLNLVFGSLQSYQFDNNFTFISNFFANFNSITSIHTNVIHFKYFQI